MPTILQKLPGVKRDKKVSISHVRKAVRGISTSLQLNNKESARLYAADLLSYLQELDILPEGVKCPY